MRSKTAIDKQLTEARNALGNASEPPVSELLAAYGYGSQRIAQGQALYQAALDALATQRKELGEQSNAAVALDSAWDTADTDYGRLIKIARVAFKKNAGTLEELGLMGARKRSASGWIDQAERFYTALENNPSHQATLTSYGITSQRITAARSSFEAMKAAQQAYNAERGDAEDATQHRDAAFDTLDEWLSDFTAIARVALDEHPQLLEKLGINVRS